MDSNPVEISLVDVEIKYEKRGAVEKPPHTVILSEAKNLIPIFNTVF